MSRSRLPLSPDEARRLLWLRSLEEADNTGTIVPGPARVAASREADNPEDAAFLLRRFDILARQIPPGLAPPDVPASGWLAKLPSWTPWAITGAAFAIGWITNQLGPDREINILSFPLLGLIVWNLAVCLASAWADWKSRRRPAPAAPRLRRAAGDDAATAARAEFAARTAAWERPKQAARAKLTFHAAAIALAAGIIAGMYARGLAKEYHAAWQSTFLTRPQVKVLTGAVLGPASLITRIKVPDPGEMNQPQPTAAPWIHLWAASAALFIFIPRLILVNMARTAATRARPDYRAEFDNWLTVCRSLASGGSQKADVLPVHYEPEAKVRDSIRLILQHRWGAHVGADFLPAAPYASEGPEISPAAGLVLVFPLATTPESEVHGAFIAASAAAGPEFSRRLLVLDASGFESRFRTLPEYPQRLATRRAAWEKIAAGAFPVLVLDEAARRDPAAAARSVSPA